MVSGFSKADFPPLDAGTRSAIAQWNAERDEVLRALDPEKFEAFWTRWRQPRPLNGWASPEVPFIMMHKARLQVNNMTEAEKAASREWLLSRGYGLEIWS